MYFGNDHGLLLRRMVLQFKRSILLCWMSLFVPVSMLLGCRGGVDGTVKTLGIFSGLFCITGSLKVDQLRLVVAEGILKTRKMLQTKLVCAALFLILCVLFSLACTLL